MATVAVRYVGPFDRVDLKPNGPLGTTLATVTRGGVVEVAESYAGRPPGPWEPHVDDHGELLKPTDDGRAYRPAGNGFEVQDLGEGLLASVDWQPATDPWEDPLAVAVEGVPVNLALHELTDDALAVVADKAPHLLGDARAELVLIGEPGTQLVAVPAPSPTPAPAPAEGDDDTQEG